MQAIKIISSAGSIGMGVAFLWHFSNILRYGQHVIQEPSYPMLIGEILFIVILIILATIKIINEIGEDIRHDNSNNTP